MPIRVINDAPEPIKFQLQYLKPLTTKVDVSLGLKAGPVPELHPGVAVEQMYKDYNPGTWMTLKANQGMAKVSQRFGMIHRNKATVTILNERTRKTVALPIGLGWIRVRPEINGVQEVWTKGFAIWPTWSRALQLDNP